MNKKFDLEKLFDKINKERNTIIDKLRVIADKDEHMFMNKLVDYYAKVAAEFPHFPIKYITTEMGYDSKYMKALDEYYITCRDLEVYLAQIQMYEFGIMPDIIVYEKQESGYYKPKVINNLFPKEEENILRALVTLCMFENITKNKIINVLYEVFIKHNTEIEAENKELVDNFASDIRDIVDQYYDEEYDD